MSTVPTSIWETTPGLTQRLQDLHAAPENYSASEMAKMLSREFGVALTRNAIIGKSRRLAMPPRPVRIKTGPKVRQYSPRPRVRPPLLPQYVPPPANNGEPITIYQLGYGDCKYPLGDYPHLYCGKASDEGRSYCGEHHALTHHPARKVWE